MAKVTKEVMQSLVDAHVFTPRHPQGCPKNYARTFPMVLAAMGLSVEEIKERVQREFDNLPCTCKPPGWDAWG